MRLFYAVALDDAVTSTAGEIGRRLRREVDASVPGGLKASWVNPDRFHVTLHFLGDMDEGQIAHAREALSEPFPIAAFDVSLGPLGAFPPRGRIRAVWIGIDRGNAELKTIHHQLGVRLTERDLPCDGRPFTPHLTLARIKQPFSGRRWTTVHEPAMDSAACRVDRVTLFHSRPGPGGSSYDVVAEARLT
jgi:RNA 2',3'-cyclic 3'-phosphodiesterase